MPLDILLNNLEVHILFSIITHSGDLSLALDMHEHPSSTPTGTLDLSTVDDSVTQQESSYQVSKIGYLNLECRRSL